MKQVNKTVASRLFQYNIPNNCGAEIRGISTIVAIVNNVSSASTKKTNFEKTHCHLMEVKPSGRSAFPNFQRRQMAKPVSATGQKNIKSMANGLIASDWLTSKIEHQTSR